MSSLRLPFLFAALIAVAGCKPEVPARDGVEHLDLRLEGGGSSAQELEAGELIWVDVLEPAGPESDLGAWSTQYGRVDAVADGGRGVALRGIVPEETRMKRIELRSSKSYQASEIDFIELELARTVSGIARVAWRSSLDSPEMAAYPRSTTAMVPTTHDAVRIRIPLAPQPGWVGEIRELSIAPKEEGMQRFDVVAVRLGRVGFTPGPDPLDGAEAGDGGMIAQGREARRAYPSDWNVPLFAFARVPRGGKLSFDAGVSTNTTNLTAEVRFVVDARLSPGEPWRRVAATSIVPGMRAQGPAWERVCEPLEAFEGSQVELRFLANAGEEPAEGGKLERARLYWGEPMVWGEAPRERRPDVILITLDTTRADALGAYRGLAPGAPSPTPFIDSLAARGILYEEAYTACNSTSPAHGSLMTGLAVQDHGLHDNRSLLAPVNTTLAEAFRAAGWHTAAAVSVAHLTPGKSGLGQGFDRFWLGQEDSAADGARTIAAVKDWLRDFAREGDRPTFLWVHLFDAHTPYAVPDAFLKSYAARMGLSIPDAQASPATLPTNRWTAEGQFLAQVTSRERAEFLYGACVAYTDELLRQLFAELRQPGTRDDTVIAVIADHGESLGERDNWYHHTSLYREVMHVPMILIAPGAPRGLRVKEPVWSLDLARTLFAVAGQDIPPEVRGSDLLSFVPNPQRRIFFEHSDLHQVGCTDAAHTAIYSVVEYLQRGAERKLPAGTLELYDRVKDPGQLHDLGGTPSERTARYLELIQRWRASALNRERRLGGLTPEEEARLKQLGY